MTHCEVRQLLYVLLQYFFLMFPAVLFTSVFFLCSKKKNHTGKKNDF